MKKDLTREQFSDFLRTYPVDGFDRRLGVVWFKDDADMVQCADSAQLRNHQEGGRDPVCVVFAEQDKAVDAVAELESFRKKRAATGAG